jgi:alpha-N-acetylglucosaminidase
MRLLRTVICLAAAVGTVVGITAPSTAGIEALVQRRLPRHVHSWEFSIVNASVPGQGNDTYTVSSTKNGTILVEGNTISALSMG